MAQEILPKFMGMIFWYLETQMDDPPVCLRRNA